MFKYEPSTKKEKLIYEICRLQPHYTFGDNAEELWNADDDELAELLEEYEDEDIEVCPYCGHERGNKFQCCGEVHWTKRSEMEDA